MFIDVNYLVRKMVGEYSSKKNVETHICDIAVLPGMLRSTMEDEHSGEWKKVQANAYASLMEMEHFSMRRWDKYSFLSEDGEVDLDADLGGVNAFKAIWDPRDTVDGQVTSMGAPWDFCYLIDNSNQAYNGELNPAQVFEMVAEYLMLDFEPTAFGARKRSYRSNAVANYLTGDYCEQVPNEQQPIYSNIYSRRT